MLDPCICQSVSLQSCLTVKAVKASTNMSNISYKSCKLLWYAKREIYTEYLCLLSQKKSFSQDYLILAPSQMCSKSAYHCPNGPKTHPDSVLMYC